MTSRHLHPNLARLAASYDDVMERYGKNQLSEDEAKRLIRNLVARDDQGIQWSIDPDDGQWFRYTLKGAKVKDTPPEAGIATHTGWDISGGGDKLADPRLRVVDEEIDPRAYHDPANLPGATARYVRNAADDTEPPPRPLWWWGLVGLLAVIFVVSLLMTLLS
jgi:hypothetical protein